MFFCVGHIIRRNSRTCKGNLYKIKMVYGIINMSDFHTTYIERCVAVMKFIQFIKYGWEALVHEAVLVSNGSHWGIKYIYNYRMFK